MKTITTIALLLLSVSTFAKDRKENNSNVSMQSSCQLESADNRFWHSD
jgi:hypothetical protein